MKDVSERARIPALDGLRGIAALMVVVWHLTGGMLDPTEGSISNAIHAATIFGRTGVDLFFVLSGFLIIGILVDQRSSANQFSVFYIRRSMRILPPYLTLVGVYWLCFWVLGPSAAFNADPRWWVQLGAQMTFTYNWLMAWADGGVARGFSITWSVAIEEWFYLIFPALLVATPREHIWRLLLFVGLASAAGRALLHLNYPSLWQAPYVLMPFRLDGLCAGGLVALAVRDARVRFFFDQWGHVLRPAAGALVLFVPAIIALTRHDLSAQMYLWGHLYLSVAFALLVLNIAIAPARYGWLSALPLRLAGRYSYSLYLFHPLFLSLVFILADRPERIETWHDAGLTGGALALTILFCVALYEIVERRAIGFGHRFRYVADEPVVSATASSLRP